MASRSRRRPSRRPMWAQVVRALEVDRVDLLVGHEVLDVHAVVALDPGRLEVLVLEVHELAAVELVRLDDLFIRDLLFLLLADLLVADPASVLPVHEPEVQVVLVDGAYSLTGALTSPKEIAPVQIARGTRRLFLGAEPRNPHGPQFRCRVGVTGSRQLAGGSEDGGASHGEPGSGYPKCPSAQ